MDKEGMISKAAEIVRDQFALDKQPEADDAFSDFKADSLDMVELVMALEENFDTEIADEEAENIETFGQLCDALAKNLKL